MTNTPGPCGCRVRKFLDVHRNHIIDYCPTHAAAFEAAKELEGYKWLAAEMQNRGAKNVQELSQRLVDQAEAREGLIAEAMLERDQLTSQNADLLAALKEAMRVLQDQAERDGIIAYADPPRWLMMGGAAIAKAEGEG